jgi:hypothetical protein
VYVGDERVVEQTSPVVTACVSPPKYGCDLSDQRAKLIIYEAFFGGMADLPKHLGSVVHEHYFEPKYPEFEPRTLWSLENAFTSALKELEPVARLRYAGQLAPFLSVMPTLGLLAPVSVAALEGASDGGH